MSSSLHRSAATVVMYHCLLVSVLEWLSDVFSTCAGDEMGNLSNVMAVITKQMAPKM